MTLKDIARLAGVSPAAVSLVLNNKPGVGKVKREEILSLLQQYRYGEPKAGISAPAGALLFLKYIRNGLVVEENTGFVASILDSIEAQCRELNYLLRIEVSRGNLAQTVSKIDFAGLQGVFVLGTELEEADLPVLSSIPVPYIVLDNRMPHAACTSITMDNYEMVHTAVAHLHELGFTRIGYLQSSMSIQNFDDRADSLRRSVAEFGMTCLDEHIIRLAPYMIGSYDGMKEYLAGRQESTVGSILPPCLFADNDTIAIGAMKAIAEAGYRIPDDVSVIGFDDICFSAVHSPSLSTMRVPTALIGRLAVRTLEDAINDEEMNGCKVLVGGRLIPRHSTAARKETAAS